MVRRGGEGSEWSGQEHHKAGSPNLADTRGTRVLLEDAIGRVTSGQLLDWKYSLSVTIENKNCDDGVCCDFGTCDTKQERKQKLLNRRANSPKDVKRNAFHSWFDIKRKNELYWESECKKHDKQWKVKLGLMIERLPVITPDLEDWELEYYEMKAQFDRETSMVFPKEIVGFGDPMEEEILTREEIMGECLCS